MPAQEWTVNALSVELRRDRRTVNRVIDENNIEPVRIRGRSKLYHMADIVNAMFADDRLDLTEERAKLARAQRIKVERDNQIATERKMIPLEEVEAAFRELKKVLDVLLLNHFSNRKLPPLLALETDVHKCAALLRQARDEMFEMMGSNFRGNLHNSNHKTTLWGRGGDDVEEPNVAAQK